MKAELVALMGMQKLRGDCDPSPVLENYANAAVQALREAGMLSANPADDFDLAKLHEEAFGAGFQAACDFYKVEGVK